MTQQQLADRASVHVVQIRRYEGSVSQPAVDVFKRLAIALSVSADALLFDEGERGADEEFRLQFEALGAMSDDERHVVKAVLEAMIFRNRLGGAVSGTSAGSAPAQTAATNDAATTLRRPKDEEGEV
ncbi:helix-turn-helix domain-containing protein [Burkholderia sp. SRS-W-2-2016]|uniref:helix-turn-helix domain-containing protein n=1 Tax=Burkholderia sp. SRS-W-2-2016 TaxID=1926878 RepID=UPI002116E4DB|nr:helix-turn-helix transcriptional regulator [Burkholderia sp. SRS-W-2-2016]